MKQNDLTPQEVWAKLIEFDEAYDDASEKEDNLRLSSGELTDKVEEEMQTYLKDLAEKPNAEEIYLFIIKKDVLLSNDDLQVIASAVADKSFAESIFKAIMAHRRFLGFDDDLEFTMLSNHSLLEAYWKSGFNLNNQAEIALFSQPNTEDLLSEYLSYGCGLCEEAQKHFLALPKEQMKKIFTEFINSITAKNYSERLICQPGFFTMLKDKDLFDLYVKKITPFKKGMRGIFPSKIAFVARRKGWL